MVEGLKLNFTKLPNNLRHVNTEEAYPERLRQTVDESNYL